MFVGVVEYVSELWCFLDLIFVFDVVVVLVCCNVKVLVIEKVLSYLWFVYCVGCYLFILMLLIYLVISFLCILVVL